jgi:integrase
LKMSMPLSMAAIHGWKKRTIVSSYPPVTWPLTCAIALRMSRRPRRYREGVGILLAFDCLLRASELLNLRREDVSDSNDPRHNTGLGMIVTIHKAKTGRNQCVQVHDRAVQKLLRDLVLSTPRGGRLFPFSYAVLLRSFKAACTDLGLSQRYTLHSLRHGGATYWRYALQKSMESVMQRGRWRSSTSARIYLDAGHAQQSAVQASPRMARCGVRISRDILHFWSLSQGHEVGVGITPR